MKQQSVNVRCRMIGEFIEDALDPAKEQTKADVAGRRRIKNAETPASRKPRSSARKRARR